MRFLNVSVLSVCLLLSVASGAAAAVITVTPGPNAIQNAVNAASPGDTIVINDGFYPENVMIVGLDDLHLVAADAGSGNVGSRQVGVGGPFLTSVVVDGGWNPGQSCLWVLDSQRVSINGITFQSCDFAGVHIQGSGPAIEDNRLFGSLVRISNGPGLFLDNALRTQVQGNAFFSSQGSSGVVVDGRQTAIVDNTFRGNVDAGIQTLNGATLTYMINNHLIGNGVGIYDDGILSRIESNEALFNTSVNVFITSNAQQTDLAGNRANGSYVLLGAGLDFAPDNI